jgi:hypothetical protein
VLPNPFALAFAPLLVPCMDVVRVYLHRVRHGQSPFLPDKNHIHHKLIACGLGPHSAMIALVCASLLLTLANILLSGVMDITLLLLVDAVFYTVANLLLTRFIKAKSTKLEESYLIIANESLQHEIA